jgi:Zn-dependent M28 family amino/carboxypeptidase
MNGSEKRGRVFHATIRAALAFFAVSLGLSCDGTDGPIDGQRAYAHAREIVSYGPRPPGSPALAKAGDYLVRQIRDLGLTPQEQTWQQSVEVYGKPVTLALRNVWTEVPGKDPENGPIVLLAAHYDSKLMQGHPDPAHNFEFVGALDGGATSGILLELARALHERKGKEGALAANVWIAWFDAEESLEYDWVNEKSLLGSRHFATTMAADKKRFPSGLSARLRVMVLLDLLGDHNWKIDRDTRSNAELADIFQAAAADLGLADRVFRYESPMYDDHVPFKDLGVSVIDLIDFRWRPPSEQAISAEQWKQRGVDAPAKGTYRAWWHTPDDKLDNVSADALAEVGNLVWHALPAIDASLQQRHGR